jgi:hypothetical protein
VKWAALAIWGGGGQRQASGACYGSADGAGGNDSEDDGEGNA